MVVGKNYTDNEYLEKIAKAKMHRCECGFGWEHGQPGDHMCSTGYRKQIQQLQKERELLTAKAEELKTESVLAKAMSEAITDLTGQLYRKSGEARQLQKELDELRELVKNVYLDIHISELTQTRKSVIKVWRSGQEYYAELTAHRG